MDINCKDEENFLKGIRTEPRSKTKDYLLLKPNRTPLASRNHETTSNSTKNMFLSEPIKVSKNNVRVIQIKNESQDFQDLENTSKQADCTKINVSRLAKILDFDTQIENEFESDENDELKMFEFLEKEGRLSPEILTTFCKCTKIRKINMTNSYAGIIGVSGLMSESKYSAILCTKPFYKGFRQIQSIDFTNVKLGDDEVRYLIRLPKLQALGLSGTLITDKGVKYLSIHSTFKDTLKCLKLCYIKSLSDSTISYLKSFKRLKSLDLRGNENLSINGCLDLIEDENTRTSDYCIKLPANIHEHLSDLHIFYFNLYRNDPRLLIASNDVDLLTLDETKFQLKAHKAKNPDVYLNNDLETLKILLKKILKRREKEETLYLYSKN